MISIFLSRKIRHFSLKKNDFSLKKNDFSLKKAHRFHNRIRVKSEENTFRT